MEQQPSNQPSIKSMEQAGEDKPRAPVRFGIIVPSSNTSLEPLTQALVSGISTAARPVTVHFARIRMTQLGLTGASAAQFQHSAFLTAAEMLVDAKVNAIGWSGTSAGWLGFQHDEELCSSLSRKFSIPVTTSTLALNKLLKLARVEKLGLVTPYTPEMNAAIVQNYTQLGYPVSPDRVARPPRNGQGLTTNQEIGALGEEELTDMVRQVVVDGKADAVTTFCTNLNAAHLVEGWEKELGVPVFDSVSTVVWDLCRLCDVEMGGADGRWGKMFF